MTQPAAAPLPPRPTAIELHLGTDPRFTRTHGAAVRALGGTYSDVRGFAHRRYVTIPVNFADECRREYALDLADELARLYGSGEVPVVLRGEAIPRHLTVYRTRRTYQAPVREALVAYGREFDKWWEAHGRAEAEAQARHERETEERRRAAAPEVLRDRVRAALAEATKLGVERADAERIVAEALAAGRA